MGKWNGDMKFGIGMYPWGKEPPTFEKYVEVAKLAEELGTFDAVHIPLHTVFPSETWIFPDFGNEFMFDMAPLVTGLAARTDDIRVAINSTVPNLYNPYMTARKVATIDHISSGRLIFGVAPGWIEEEYELVGEDYENRGNVMVESIKETLKFFTEENADYEFNGVHISDLGLEPEPVQDPHPPIWYAGSSYAAVQRAGDFADNLCLYCKDLSSRSLIGDRIQPDLDDASGDRSVDLSIYTFAAVCEGQDERERMDEILLRSYKGWSGEGNEHELSLVGDSEEVRENVYALEEEGIDYTVLDLNTHGLEDMDKLKDRMETFHTDVIQEL